MTKHFIDLPKRAEKPREKGWTILIDGGIATGQFTDVLNAHHDLIDFVKFGWGTSMVTKQMDRKMSALAEHEIPYFFGGTLFEKALSQNKLAEYRAYLKDYRCQYLEISNGTLSLTNSEKCQYIREFSDAFKVFSEVGYKDHEKSQNMHPAQWIECIKQDLKAGAVKVITEARESGQSGVCRSNGELRFGLIEEIVSSGIDMNSIVFEAPNKYLQTYFIKRFGVNVNLANIAFEDVIGLETLRVGLRSDTFFLNEVKA